MQTFHPRAEKWSSADLFSSVNDSHVTASPQLRKAVRRNLWGDMCAEYDARHLWHHLQNLGLSLSEEFLATLRVWFDDEKNHYEGLRFICGTMYGIAPDTIDAEMAQRSPDFAAISPFLNDEFEICAVLAYDELVSARGYRLFFKSFKKFGPPEFEQWVRRASRDEAIHFQNFVDVMRIVHPERLTQVPDIIDRIVAYEADPAIRYHATFLLDHTGETLSREFLLGCAQAVLGQCRGEPASWSTGDQTLSEFKI